jgi:hypothetical protein
VEKGESLAHILLQNLTCHAFRSSLSKVGYHAFRFKSDYERLLLGIITTSIGILLLFFIPADPLKSRFLNDTERRLTIIRLNADQIVKTDGKKEPATLRLVLRSFNIWVCPRRTMCAAC